MKLVWLTALVLSHICVGSLALAQSDASSDLTDEELKLFYGLFKDVDRFGLISLTLVGDAEKVGLDENQLTKYLDDKFGTYFCHIKYEDLSQNPAKLAIAIAKRDPSIGIISFRVWVIGDDYPLAYHVRCDAGSFRNPSIWSEEVLGHGARKTVPAAIKGILDELLQQLAENFLKARGEKCLP